LFSGRSRKELVMLLLAATLWLSSGLPATTLENVLVEASPVLEDRFPQAKVPFGEGVEASPDVVYSVPPGFRPLRLDLYRPRASGDKREKLPLVVYVHGGGWQSGHTRHAGAFGSWPNVLAMLASRGYVVASIEYRLSGEARFPAAIHDVKTAIRWLRRKSSQLGIDPGRVIVWGGSAGGQLAALAATSCEVESLAPVFLKDGQPDLQSPLNTQSDCVQGLVAWYGVFDFTGPLANLAQRETGSPVGKYLGCALAECAEVAALASATTHLDRSDPPALLIHGELDKVVPSVQSTGFDAAARVKGVKTELLIIKGIDHSFIGANPSVTRDASLQALQATFAFFDSITRPARTTAGAR
jgi:acetyl esterase/lipase